MIINEIIGENKNAAMDLAIKVFMRFEAPSFSEEGINEFVNTVKNPEYVNNFKVFGAFIGEMLIGVIATRKNGSHIALFFVDEKYQRQGIGKALFYEILKYAPDTLTVNSAPYAVEIYKKLGFKPDCGEKISNGIRYTPMTYIKRKKLSEMTLEELWRLFPIFLTEHKECWEDWYKEEERNLQQILCGNEIIRINHIGSTAVKTIWAKPIIDILVETDNAADWGKIKKDLTDNGYICMCENQNRISFNKGYTEDGFAQKVFHLHLRRTGDNGELYFRDYLNDFPLIAKDYENLKIGIWKKFEHDRDVTPKVRPNSLKNIPKKQESITE